MDEHLQAVVGKADYIDMEDTFVEATKQLSAKRFARFARQVAEDEPRPGWISREDFAEIAGIYVYNQLYQI